MTTQLPLTESKPNPGLNLFSASSVKFWGVGGAALAGLMLFPHSGGGEIVTGLSVLGMGTFLFWNRLNPNQLPVRVRPEQISRNHFNHLCTEIEELFTQIQTESEGINETELESLKSSLATLRANCDRNQVHVAITGDVGVGKTALLNQLNFTDSVSEVTWSGEDAIPETIADADLTLFLAQGDLTQSELNRIQALQTNHKPCLVILNKVDQFRAAQLDALLQKRSQVLKEIDTADQLTIAAHPQTILVRRHQEDGSFLEVEEQPAAQLTELTERLTQRLSAEGRSELVLQQSYNQAEQLRLSSLQTLNGLRRTKALPILEKYQWLSATAAFASPLPSTDMIATAAITGKLITDLGELYQHQFSINEAQNIAAILVKAFLKLGLVELSSQLLGGVLKSHAATYVAGGFIQGLSVAYLTHIAGLSLIEHFESMAIAGEQGSQLSLANMTQIVEKVFAQNQRVDFLKGLVGQGINRLQPAQ